jgi:hypothetical protein
VDRIDADTAEIPIVQQQHLTGLQWRVRYVVVSSALVHQIDTSTGELVIVQQQHLAALGYRRDPLHTSEMLNSLS